MLKKRGMRRSGRLVWGEGHEGCEGGHAEAAKGGGGERGGK